MSLAFAALLWIHIIGAVGWLGAGMVFAMLIGPTLPSLTPASRGDLIVKLLPKYIMWVQIFTLITPIFGLVLVLDISHGNMSVFSLSPALDNHFGFYITLGALLSLVAWGLVFGFVTPTARRIVWFTKEVMKNPTSPPPAGLLKANARLRVLSTIGLIVLFLIVACMVYAATSP